MQSAADGVSSRDAACCIHPTCSCLDPAACRDCVCVPRLDVRASAEPVRGMLQCRNIGYAMLQVGSDPFTEMRQAKRERLKKNEKQQMGNLKVAMKQSGPRALPGTVKLAASLPQHGNGRPSKRKDTEDDVRR